MKNSLEMIDKRIRENDTSALMKEVIVVMLRAAELMPKKKIKQEEFEAFQGEIQKKYFKGYSKAFEEFARVLNSECLSLLISTGLESKDKVSTNLRSKLRSWLSSDAHFLDKCKRR